MKGREVVSAPALHRKKGEITHVEPEQLPLESAPLMTSQYVPSASEVENVADHAESSLLIATNPAEPVRDRRQRREAYSFEERTYRDQRQCAARTERSSRTSPYSQPHYGTLSCLRLQSTCAGRASRWSPRSQSRCRTRRWVHQRSCPRSCSLRALLACRRGARARRWSRARRRCSETSTSERRSAWGSETTCNIIVSKNRERTRSVSWFATKVFDWALGTQPGKADT